jgi:DNA mismatch endonuclease, patch repair protein
MADIVDRKTRSRMMSGIRGKNTRAEKTVRSLLHRTGLRFCLHDVDLPGRPDIVLPRHTAVIEVLGCFWHRHRGCEYAYEVKRNKNFWHKKFAANVLRDQLNHAEFKESGWRLKVVWECELRQKSPAQLRSLGKRLNTWVLSRSKAKRFVRKGRPK